MPFDTLTVPELLAYAGLRRTPWRVRILSLLLQLRRPVSHGQIMGKLGARADRVTVYRTLDAFVRSGLVHRVLVGRRMHLYETADRCTKHACHPHFTCRACGRTTCMTELAPPRVRGRRKGYVFERQRVLIEGLCPACAAGS